MDTIQIGLIGFGTVGTGVVKILQGKNERLNSLTGVRLNLKRIADLDLKSDRGLSIPPGILINQADQILNDPEISIVIELMGGLEPARSFILKALNRGKHVITANKALLAQRGEEIFKTASDKGLEIGFEASVCGGIPVILALQKGLVANEIESILGIFNGTSNYILTQMTEEGQSYAEALKGAQEKGYAEADPTLDVEGLDTLHKLSILMHLAYGAPLNPEAIFVEGITRVGSLDIAFAREFGYSLKLLAICRKDGNQLQARIHPTMISQGHMLAKVQGAYNALYIRGDAVEDLLLYGKGAGMMPTGSAVISDLVSIGRHISKGVTPGMTSTLSTRAFAEKRMVFQSFSELVIRYYFRFSALDRPGVLSTIAGVLGEHQISIASVIQKGRDKKGSVPIVMMTHEAKEADVQTAIKKIDQLPVITGPTVIIRVEN